MYTDDPYSNVHKYLFSEKKTNILLIIREVIKTILYSLCMAKII